MSNFQPTTNLWQNEPMVSWHSSIFFFPQFKFVCALLNYSQSYARGQGKDCQWAEGKHDPG